MNWKKDKVFGDGKAFVEWLDKHFKAYVSNHISELHVHHTWRPNHSNKESTLQLHKNMRNYHVNNNKWSDIGQHISIGKDGKVVLGRSIKRMPASAKGFNGSNGHHPFMFEMIGNFNKGGDKLSGKQLDTVLTISRYFHVDHSKALKFHREMDRSQTCPGTSLDKKDFVSMVKGEKQSKPKKKPSKPKPSKPQKKKGANLKVDGKWGELTTRALQKDLGTTVDGVLSDQLRNSVTNALYGNTARFGNGKIGSMVIKALQRNLGGLKVDGLLGPATVRALQDYLGTVKDGKLSRPSLVVEEMQKQLNAGTF